MHTTPPLCRPPQAAHHGSQQWTSRSRGLLANTDSQQLAKVVTAGAMAEADGEVDVGLVAKPVKRALVMVVQGWAVVQVGKARVG